MRIRSIKPDFFKCEDLADLDPLARLLFIGLWCMADSEGRLEDRPRRIKAEVFPYHDADIEALLAALCGIEVVRRYTASGVAVVEVVNFKRHQRLSGKEASAASMLPPPPEDDSGEAAGKQRGSSGDFTNVLEGKGREGKGRGVGEGASPAMLADGYRQLAEPETVVAWFRRVSLADPSPAYLAAWRGSIAELQTLKAEPGAVAAGLRWFEHAEPKRRGRIPAARFLNADWFLQLVQSSGAEPGD